MNFEPAQKQPGLGLPSRGEAGGPAMPILAGPGRLSAKFGRHGLILGVCLLISILVGLVFGQTLRYGFVDFDDDVYVFNNPMVSGGLTLKSTIWAFTHVESSNWHPLTWMSHMLDCRWYGLNAGNHHLTNILLHGLTAILLFLVLLRMTGALGRCAFVALLFAIHPLHVESVAWIAERKDVLSGLFFMLTLGAYARYARLPWSAGRYALVLALLALGLMCKPMLVTLPFVLLLLDFWPLNRWRARDIGEPKFQMAGWEFPRRLILEKIPLLMLSLAASGVTLVAQQAAMASPPFALRIENAVVSWAVYVEQMFYPARLAVFYPYPADGFGLGKIIISFSILVIITASVALACRKQPWLLTGWLWYLGMLVPVIGILQVGAQSHADRYTYLPQIGLYVLLTWTVTEWWGRRHYGRQILGGLAATVIVASAMCARVQASYWRNSESLWTHSLACTADNLTARINLGNALLQAGKLDAALTNFQIAIQLAPASAEARYNLGNALLLKGELSSAAGQFQKALEIKPDYAAARMNLGNVFFRQGKLDEAIMQLRQAVDLTPDDAEACYDLGNALSRQGKLDEAVGWFQQALRLSPNNTDALGNLGIALLQENQVAAAIRRFQRALEIEPDDAKSSYNLGVAMLHQGNIDAAMGRFKRALALKPDYAEAAYNLGMALLQKGNLNEAKSHLLHVLQIKPGDSLACYNLGNIYVQSGELDEAVVYYQRALQINADYADAANNLAWLWATAPSASLRNGGQALVLARRANGVTGGKDSDVLDTLAAACAETGQFADARENARDAIELARAAGDRDEVEQLSGELKLYEAGLPYHQEPK